MLRSLPRYGLVLLVIAAFLLAGCGTTADDSSYSAEDPVAAQDEFDFETAEPSGEGDTPSEEPELVDVPDTTGDDGTDAVSTLEDRGLTVSFSEEDGRDPSGCNVEEQDTVGEAAPGSDVELALDCRQVDWENQEGEDWDTFNTAYSSGWDSGCDEAFSQSPDGSLYFDEEEFTASDCQSNNPGDATSGDIPSDVPDYPDEDGQEMGQSDGCESAFSDLSPDGTYLYYGEDSYDSSVCP